MDLSRGEKLVKLAREAISSYFSKKEIKPLKEITKEFEKKSGVFVTILTYPQKELRGCMGFIFPKSNLYESVQQAARHAAFSDPRFSPIKEQELNQIILEVSILTEPELIKVSNPNEYPQKIEIGKDGLIIESEPFKGLLLPNVAIEHKWNTEQFLNHACLKAGLLEETWREGTCKVYKFQTEIFKEKVPNGSVIKV